MDTQEADSACQSAASALESLMEAALVLKFHDEAAAALDSIADDIDGTDLAGLIDSMSSALTDLFGQPLETDRLKQLELALEARHTTSEAGLWCVRNTSSSVAEDIAQVFFSTS